MQFLFIHIANMEYMKWAINILLGAGRAQFLNLVILGGNYGTPNILRLNWYLHQLPQCVMVWSLWKQAAAARKSVGGGAASNNSEASFSCFGAICSVVRAATDYCRYGNLRQYLLIDPSIGEPQGFLIDFTPRQTIT